jgi:hypothetical protein
VPIGLWVTQVKEKRALSVPKSAGRRGRPLLGRASVRSPQNQADPLLVDGFSGVLVQISLLESNWPMAGKEAGLPKPGGQAKTHFREVQFLEQVTLDGVGEPLGNC